MCALFPRVHLFYLHFLKAKSSEEVINSVADQRCHPSLCLLWEVERLLFRVCGNFAEQSPHQDWRECLANMSSRNDRNTQPTMLIITRSIYAKRSNDAFYTGNIETKLPDGSYLVKFMDGASESVEERDIMWLGFWGLPPWTWPRNPIVQSAGPANVDFLNGLVQNENTKEPIPNSVPFNTLFHEADVGTERRDNDFSELDIKADVSTRTEMRNTEELDSVEQMSAHVLPRESSESKNQTRCV